MCNFFKTRTGVALVAVFYTFLWGTAFPLVKLCMEGFAVEDDLTKCLVAGIRFTVSGAALVIGSLAINKKDALPKKSEILPILLYGALGTAIQYAFTYIGLSRVDGSKGAIFDQLCVFIIIIVSGLLLKNDKLTPLKILGCVLGLFGVFAVNTESMSFTFSMLGEGMMILAALCQTGAYIVATLGACRISAVKLVGYGQLFGGILLVGVTTLLGARINTVSTLGILMLLSLSAISAIAYCLSLIPLKYFPASEVSVYNLLITVFGVVMSGLILGENIFKINYLISLLLISLGIIAVNFKLKNNKRIKTSERHQNEG